MTFPTGKIIKIFDLYMYVSVISDKAYIKMIKRFTSTISQEHIEIFDYKPPEPGEDKTYPAVIYDNQFAVMKITDVSNSVQCEDISLTNICDGVLETEVLPLLSSSSQNNIDIKPLIYIEKCGQHVIYR